MKEKWKEKKEKRRGKRKRKERKGRKEKERAAVGRAASNHLAKAVPGVAEWRQVIPSASRHRWDEHYQMLR